MECLKCGRETAGKEVFCADCLKDMERSPVSVNTPVVIHHRKVTSPKVPQKKAPKPEEIIEKLNKKLKHLRIAVSVLLVLLAITAGALGYVVWAGLDDPNIGSNYSTVTFPTEGGRR